MKKILFLTDYIENEPVVASVRYENLIKYLNKKYEITVINNYKYGSFSSKYSSYNLKFNKHNRSQPQSRVSNNSNKNLNKILKNKYILTGIRSVLHSNFIFNYKNKDFYKHLMDHLESSKYDCVFVTVPYINSLYILKKIKKKYPDLPVVVEIRDIIAHDIGKGYPKMVYRKAESLIYEFADKIIVLTEGIFKYYSKKVNNDDILLIKNGYDLEYFEECMYRPIDLNKGLLSFAHIGTIYEGRNLYQFLESLVLLKEKLNVTIEFNVVGLLDEIAHRELDEFLTKNPDKIDINIFGTVPHKQAIEYLKKCDIPVILTHKQGSDYAIPGKTFEYIGACKPILAVTEDMSLINFIDGKYGECAEHNPRSIFENMVKILNKNYDFSDREQYSRRNQAANIITTINSVLN